MQLTLQYDPSPGGPVAAAFVAGNNMQTWFAEISRWKLKPSQMEWYVLPASRKTGTAAGLFIIFKKPVEVEGLELLEPYVELTPGLFIPLYSSLTPQVRQEEWKQLLIWDQQLFHPVLGFIGFEKKDRVEPASMISIGPATVADWSFANPGLMSSPLLIGIEVIQPSAQELVSSMKQDIGGRSLDVIPSSGNEKSILRIILDWLLFGIFSLLSLLLIGLMKIIPMPVISREGQGGYSPGDGLMQKLSTWFNRNMGDLQQKRDREMERLLKMFEKNDKEALQYAIPLDSPYLNRGENKGSSFRLGKRRIDFNLKGLTGGRFAEIWDIDRYRQSLRAKYLASAKKELERKDFRRAAYIYAHLMGDYSAAANSLEQGGLYREAAALHRDHLKNIHAAASCLERGQLYTEAIGLHEQVGNHEKAGDLYLKLKNAPGAAASYEKHVDGKLGAHDYLDAARVLRDKMNNEERAKQVLMAGWQSAYQPEQCLKSYFEITMNGENDEQELRQVYTMQTPPGKRKSFLDVLGHIRNKMKDKKTDLLMQDIAYEIVHKEAASGDFTLLDSLATFVPGDKLLKSDSSRYQASHPNTTFQPGKPFFLDKTVNWKTAIRHGDQILVLGERNDFLQLVRTNEQGVLDYFSWHHIVPKYSFFHFVHDPILSNSIFLVASQEMVLEKKVLPGTRHFKESASITGPSWMRHDRQVFLMTGEDEIVSLSYSGTGVSLNYYDFKGELKKIVPCEVDRPTGRQVFYSNGKFYFFTANLFFIISADGGVVQQIDLESGVRMFTAGGRTKEPTIIISTNRGCHLLQQRAEEMKLTGEVFFKDMIPSVIVPVSPTEFAIAESRKIVIVSIADERLVAVKEFRFDAKIIAVLPGRGGVNRFVAIEESGRVSEHSYD